MNQLQENVQYLGFSSEDCKTIYVCFAKNPARFRSESSHAYDGAIEEYPHMSKTFFGALGNPMLEHNVLQGEICSAEDS